MSALIILYLILLLAIAPQAISCIRTRALPCTHVLFATHRAVAAREVVIRSVFPVQGHSFAILLATSARCVLFLCTLAIIHVITAVSTAVPARVTRFASCVQIQRR